MSTKTITVTEESYTILSSSKKTDESFSEVIKRLLTPKKDIMAYAGFISDDEAEDIKDSIRELRERSIKRLR
ncbi:antitoxin VapB family protein [Candidatus Woesearchaeota archaeon]|nr:antitoxin VapB family protein [Candidatus Woesearchaeota archaeon]